MKSGGWVWVSWPARVGPVVKILSGIEATAEVVSLVVPVGVLVPVAAGTKASSIASRHRPILSLTASLPSISSSRSSSSTASSIDSLSASRTSVLSCSDCWYSSIFGCLEQWS